MATVMAILDVLDVTIYCEPTIWHDVQHIKFQLDLTGGSETYFKKCHFQDGHPGSHIWWLTSPFEFNKNLLNDQAPRL